MIVISGAIGGGTALAGCLDPDDDDVDDLDDADDANDVDDVDDADDDPLDRDAIDQHLEDANGWEEELQDHRGEAELDIEVGDPDTGGDYRFVPIAPEIDVGTEVTWEWVDEEAHSVTHENGEFDSGVQEEYTFEHTFEEAGTYLYVCQPHRGVGHLGAIVVYED